MLVAMPVISDDAAHTLATEWIAAWNSHDLERVFRLYADDFEMRSPLIAERGFSPTGALRGKDAIRPYWGAGIATANPPIRFELQGVYAGVNQVAVHYRSIGRKIVVEVLELDEHGRIIGGSACHGAPA
jgi:ketosteroid isomerase-like protein